MKLHNFNTYFFFGVLFLVSMGAFLLFLPFLSAIFVAALFAGIFARPQRLLLKYLKGYPGTVAMLMCLFVALVIVLPIVGIGNIVIGEVAEVVEEVTTDGSQAQQSIRRVAGVILNSPVGGMIESRVGAVDLDSSISDTIANLGGGILSLTENSLGNASGVAKSFVKKTYEGIVGSVLWIFVLFFTLFYFFLDGKQFVKKLMMLSPLKDAHEELLIEKFMSMARATLKGTFIIGSIQGSLGGIAFLIAGISSPMLWFVVMVFLSVIPALGAGLVIFPAAFIMFFLGHVWQGIFLLGVGLVVTSIDNVLRPKLVGNDTQMHSLLIFFGTIGGMSVFGLIGFIVGPIILALALAMWEIYAYEFKAQLKKYNG